MELMRQYDLAGFCTADIANLYREHGIKYWYWQIGYEEAEYNGNSNQYLHTVVLQANGYSPARQQLVRDLYAAGIDLGLYGIGWPTNFESRGNTVYDFNRGAEIYATSKMAIGDSQWPHAVGYVSNRLFQAMAAGVLLLQQRFDGIEEYLGLVDGEHLVLWDDVIDLTRKIDFFSEHDAERQRIARTGAAFVREYHSFDRRVIELFKRLGWLS